MDLPEVPSHPVETMVDLIARLDLILGAAQQWAVEDDAEIGVLIHKSLNDLKQVPHLPGTEEQRIELRSKVDAIREALRQRKIKDLNAQYRLT